MPKSKKDLNVERFPQLVDALAKDKEFCSIIGRFSADRAERLDTIIQKVAPTVEYTLSSSSKSVSQNFAMHLLKTPPGTLSAAAQRLQNMFMEYTKSKPRRRQSHKDVARRIKFVGNEINYVYGLSADIPIIELDPLPTPYPTPQGHIVLERHYPTHPRKVIRPAVTCTIIVRSMNPCCNILSMQTRKPSLSTKPLKNLSLSFSATLPKTTSASSNHGQSTSSTTPTIVAATSSDYVLRNDPGQMARTGVSPGQRSGSVFGWARNLKKTKKATTGLEDHQYQVSSLWILLCSRARENAEIRRGL